MCKLYRHQMTFVWKFIMFNSQLNQTVWLPGIVRDDTYKSIWYDIKQLQNLDRSTGLSLQMPHSYLDVYSYTCGIVKFRWYDEEF